MGAIIGKVEKTDVEKRAEGCYTLGKTLIDDVFANEMSKCIVDFFANDVDKHQLETLRYEIKRAVLRYNVSEKILKEIVNEEFS
jgi:hypothetical protein